MKNKYQRMNKTEKKELAKEFFATKSGKEVQNRFNRLLIIGVMGIIFSIYLCYSSYSEDTNVFEYITAGILFAASLTFLIGRHKLKVKQLNSFAIKKSK